MFESFEEDVSDLFDIGRFVNNYQCVFWEYIKENVLGNGEGKGSASSKNEKQEENISKSTSPQGERRSEV